MKLIATLPFALSRLLSRPGAHWGSQHQVYGAPRLHITAEKLGLRAHIGAEIAVLGAGERVRPSEWLPHCVPAEPVRFSLLAESVSGYQNLCRLITRYKLREDTKAEGDAIDGRDRDCIGDWRKVQTISPHPQLRRLQERGLA
jgi:error-prone DNA polymerase